MHIAINLGINDFFEFIVDEDSILEGITVSLTDLSLFDEVVALAEEVILSGVFVSTSFLISFIFLLSSLVVLVFIVLFAYVIFELLLLEVLITVDVYLLLEVLELILLFVLSSDVRQQQEMQLEIARQRK